jgi:tRNA G10  N-methylase Trm11
MPVFLVHFAQINEPFRLPELLALCDLFGIQMTYKPDAYSPTSPFMVVSMASDEDAKKILSRAILVK